MCELFACSRQHKIARLTLCNVVYFSDGGGGHPKLWSLAPLALIWRQDRVQWVCAFLVGFFCTALTSHMIFVSSVPQHCGSGYEGRRFNSSPSSLQLQLFSFQHSVKQLTSCSSSNQCKKSVYAFLLFFLAMFSLSGTSCIVWRERKSKVK